MLAAKCPRLVAREERVEDDGFINVCLNFERNINSCIVYDSEFKVFENIHYS